MSFAGPSKALRDHAAKARKLAADGQLQAALIELRAASRSGLTDPGLRVFEARILASLGRSGEALEIIDALPPAMQSPRMASFEAEVAEAETQLERAEAALGRALAGSLPTEPLLARRSILRLALGDHEGAKADLLTAIDQRPEAGEIWRLLAPLHKFMAHDALYLKLHEAASGDLSPDDRTHMAFALAKAAEDLGDAETAFRHLSDANRLIRSRYPYDMATRLSEIAALKRGYQGRPWSQGRNAEGPQPIFVTGLPRSGTTLVEQILACHADVVAGGETGIFLTKARDHVASLMAGDIPDGVLAQIGGAYVEAIAPAAEGASFVTDKSLQSYLFAGPILQALPGAKMIVVRRNPRAVALSLLKQVFRPGKQRFSYDLDDIAAYQAAFEDILAFWQSELPEQIVTVQYEDLVASPETVIRSLLEKLGLTWDAACLHPERLERPVKTLSAWAVRQPIHTNAASTWKKYGSLLDAVDPEVRRLDTSA